jgi:Tol biopolymer transport system component
MVHVPSLSRRATVCATLGAATALTLAPASAGAATPTDAFSLLSSPPVVAGDVSVRPQGVKARATAATGTPPQIAYSVVKSTDAPGEEEGIASAVARLDPLTGAARTLVADNRRLLTAQAWSDDRFRVYFSLLSLDEEGGQFAVDSVSQAGGTPRREQADAVTLDVSRDGQRLAFVRQEGQTANIFTSNAAGGDVRRITGAGAVTVRFSQDGGRLIFTRVVSSGGLDNTDVFTVRTDGTGLTRVTGRADTEDVGGAFSPDGRRVLFSRFTDGEDLPDVYSVGIDGRGLRLVRANAFDPDWASNGWLTYLSIEGSAEQARTQVAVRAPGVPGAETVLTRERNFVTATRFAG